MEYRSGLEVGELHATLKSLLEALRRRVAVFLALA
jgi:hypothetical protein